jgi:hypothetical protein
MKKPGSACWRSEGPARTHQRAVVSPKLLAAGGALLWAGWIAEYFTRVHTGQLSGARFVAGAELQRQELQVHDHGAAAESHARHSTEALKALLWSALGEGDPRWGDTSVLKILNQAQAHDMAGLLDFARWKKTSSGETLQKLVLMRWAELDPAGAAAAAKDLRGLPPDVFAAIASQWAAKEPAAPRQWVLSLRGDEQLKAVIGLCRGLAKSDPAAALAWLSQSQHRLIAKEAYSEIFAAWAAGAPASAAGSASSLPPGQARDLAIYTVSRLWTEQDPQAALAWARTLSKRRGSVAAVQVVFEHWARKDPAAAARQALAMAHGPLRRAALASAAYGIAGEDLQAAHELVAQVTPPAAREELMRAISISLASTAPTLKAAYEYALSIPAGENRNDALEELATWSRDDEDPAETITWLAEHLPVVSRAGTLSAKLQRWASIDPPAAVQWAMKADADAIPVESLWQLGLSWGSMDADGALRWVRSQKTGARETAVLAGAAQGLAEFQPVRAAELFSQLPPGPMQEVSATTIAATWAANDPSAAAQWALQLPAGEARNNAAAGVVRSWANFDVQNAASWIERLPAGGTRDSAVAAYAEKVLGTDPKGAATWAATITDASRRENALRRAYDGWKRMDEPSAKRWVQSAAALSQEARERLLAK